MTRVYIPWDYFSMPVLTSDLYRIHNGVVMVKIIQTGAGGEFEIRYIIVTDPQRRADLEKALGRALNCWEPRPPQWLVDLYDELQQEKHDAERGRVKQP
jgi:hypothetical protein